MTFPSETLRQALFRLWFRLTTIFAAALLLALALLLFPKVSGWLYYLTFPEAVYEVSVRAAFLAFVAAALGGLGVILTAPFLWLAASRSRASRVAIQVATGAAVFLDLFVALIIMADWAYLPHMLRLGLFAAFVVAFLGSLWNPRLRRAWTSRFDGMAGKRATRATMLATGAAAIALVLAGRAQPASAKAQANQPRPHPNILLITFDALSAEDMSLYGYRLLPRRGSPNSPPEARSLPIFFRVHLHHARHRLPADRTFSLGIGRLPSPGPITRTARRRNLAAVIAPIRIRDRGNNRQPHGVFFRLLAERRFRFPGWPHLSHRRLPEALGNDRPSASFHAVWQPAG